MRDSISGERLYSMPARRYQENAKDSGATGDSRGDPSGLPPPVRSAPAFGHVWLGRPRPTEDDVATCLNHESKQFTPVRESKKGNVSSVLQRTCWKRQMINGSRGKFVITSQPESVTSTVSLTVSV
jgi:hypothetical protein